MDVSVTSDGRRLWTVFTVTDYPNWNGCNQAGFVTFRRGGGEEDVRVTRFESEEFEGCVKGFVTGDEIAEVGLRDELFLHKSTIFEGLMEGSEDGGKTVGRDVWERVMREKTGMDIGWARLLLGEEGGEVVDMEEFAGKLEDGISEELEGRWEVSGRLERAAGAK